jgi:hypothetical protein
VHATVPTRVLLRLMRLVPPLAFFKNTRLILRLLCPMSPAATATAPHVSSYPPSCMRERGNTARVPYPQCEGEHSTRAPMQRDPSYMRERRDHNARTLMQDRAQREEREEGRKHNVYAHVLSQLHAPLWGTTPGGAEASGAARACVSQSAWGAAPVATY